MQEQIKKRGRKTATGKFQTNEELRNYVLELYRIPSFGIPFIARKAQVSETTVHRIIDGKR